LTLWILQSLQPFAIGVNHKDSEAAIEHVENQEGDPKGIIRVEDADNCQKDTATNEGKYQNGIDREIRMALLI